MYESLSGDRLESDIITTGSGSEIAKTFYVYDSDDNEKVALTTDMDRPSVVYIEVDGRSVYISKEHFTEIAYALEAEDKQPGDVEIGGSDIKVDGSSLAYNYPYPPKSEYQITVSPDVDSDEVAKAVEDALKASKRLSSGYEYSVPKADSISSSRPPRRTAVMEDIQEAMDILERARKNCEELRRSL